MEMEEEDEAMMEKGRKYVRERERKKRGEKKETNDDHERIFFSLVFPLRWVGRACLPPSSSCVSACAPTRSQRAWLVPGVFLSLFPAHCSLTHSPAWSLSLPPPPLLPPSPSPSPSSSSILTHSSSQQQDILALFFWVGWVLVANFFFCAVALRGGRNAATLNKQQK